MSKAPGGFTARINCMIISGFPGIGKTSTYNEMKKEFIGAKVIDMDVRRYGTTNGIDVADPAAYVTECEKLSHENACIFVTCDAHVRQKLQEAHLFYTVVAPEFPPHMAQQLPPQFAPNLALRQAYIDRFNEKNLDTAYDKMAGRLLEGRGYQDLIEELFKDPMPHVVSYVLNRAVVDQAWMQIEALTRTTLTPEQLAKTALGKKPLGAKPDMDPFDPAGILRGDGMTMSAQQAKMQKMFEEQEEARRKAERNGKKFIPEG